MKRFKLLAVLAVIALTAVPAFSQSAGNIFGTVVDSDGAALPGVTVTLSGPAATQVFVTDGQGEFRFLGLAPGSYDVNAELSGFGSVARNDVVVNIGRNTNITMELNPALDETIVVTAETPLLDVRRTGTGATVTQVELDQIPTARDPWVILQQVPGVLMDRINVGGDQSGQQSGYVAKGISSDESTFNVDGVNTTDMIATGAASDYYDFGAFEEIQVSTGGTDPRVRTPGAQVNMVTKRGTNELEGSARYYIADGDWQDDPDIPAEAVDYLETVNRIKENEELGFEVGGPIIRDRLWLWGAYAEQEVNIIPAQRVGNFVDATTLETFNAKLNAQLTNNNSLTGFYFDNDKIKLGRNLSASRPVDAAWNQSGFGPKGAWKIEDTHIFSPNFFLTGLYSKVNGGFQLVGTTDENCTSRACAEAVPVTTKVDYVTGVYSDGYLSFAGKRPQEEYRADASSFFDMGDMNHELRFGAGLRTAGNDSALYWTGPGSNAGGGYQGNLGEYYAALGYTEEVLGFDPTPIQRRFFYSYAPLRYEYEYLDAYIGDTILWGDFVIQAGLRFDEQTASLGAVDAPGIPGYEEFVPAVTITDLPDTPEWETISPRIGITYALGEENRTLLRASYNQYVSQMGSNSTQIDELLPFATRIVWGDGIDTNGDGVLAADEIFTSEDDHPGCGVIVFCRKRVGSSGFNPNDPLDTGTPITRVGDVDAPTTDEIMLGIEHELMPNFVIGANYTHREMNDFIQFAFEKTPGGGDFFTHADYEQVGTVSPNDVTCPDSNPGCVGDIQAVVGSYDVPVWRLKEDVYDEFGAPLYAVMRNRPGYSQEYDGIELTATKRLSNRWMMRGSVSLMDWTQNVTDESFQDPTPKRTDLFGLTSFGCAGAAQFCDGQDVVSGSGTTSGAFGNVWVGADWAYNLTGLYEVPVVDVILGFNLTGREGYPLLYGHEFNDPLVEDDVTNVDVLVGDVTEYRLDDLHQLDLRLSKDFAFQGVGLQVSVDAFNVLNEQTILQRQSDLVQYVGTSSIGFSPAGSGNNITEIQSARIFRLGARLTF